MNQYPTEFVNVAVEQNREAVPQNQQRSFQALLRYVWRRSSFYRDLYSDSGVREIELQDLTPRDLPLIDKKLLMENFDAAVTDPRLRKNDLERWIDENRNPAANYRDDFIVVHSSGSSANVGISVCSRADWQIAASAVAGRLPPPVNYLAGKTRAAFYFVSHGNFGGASIAARMPRSIYDTLILSILDSHEHVASKLNDFQPHQLHGYSSSVYDLSRLAVTGKLRISPKRIFVGGDKLTKDMERDIRRVWDAPVYDLYSASECNYIALKQSGHDEMSIIEELNILEVLDNENRPVSEDQEGRVVLTNLYNYTLPILRYELGDHASWGARKTGSPYCTIKDIRGRPSIGLPVTLRDGNEDKISHQVLAALYVPGLERFQYVSMRPNLVHILYVAGENLDTKIRQEFQHILDLKGASKTAFEIRHVARIASDPRTGKHNLVRMEHDPKADRGDVIGEERPRPLFQSELGRQKVENETRSVSRRLANLPPGQQTILAKCFHPTGTFVEFPPEEIEQSIPERFEKIVRMYPHRQAVKTRDHVLTYAALDEKANRIANAIVSECGEGEEPIALLMDQDAGMIATILAILKSAKSYVSLDPSYPPARLTAMLRDSQPRVIVTDHKNLSYATELAENGHQLINIDDLDQSFSSTKPHLSPTSDTVACIFYTSGSTGEPKGVVHNHRNLLHKTMAYTNDLHICAEDRLSLLHSCSFAASLRHIFGATLTGATLCLFDLRRDGLAGFINWLNQESITIAHMAASVFRSFATELSGSDRFPALRVLYLAIETVLKRDLELFEAHFSSSCLFVNALVATEALTITQFFVDKTTAIPGPFVPVGYAIQGEEILILDEEGREAGVNEVGEITVKSPYLALGYWRKPEITRAGFSLEPKGGNQRLYRTGDLGCVLPDGSLVHLGRKDFRVKILGHRIEIAEIETALLAVEGVREAVVIGSEGQIGEKHLVAYVVPSGNSLVTVTMLRRLLADRLPHYMIPSVFVMLDALPRTPNGKIDRHALPAPDLKRPILDTPYVAPTDPTEKKLTEIWSEVLSIDRIGIHDNFFDLGGHSLAATQVLSRSNKGFQMELSFRTFFESPTVADMARVIIENQAKKSIQEQQISSILAEVESLSEEETQHRLLEGDK